MKIKSNRKKQIFLALGLLFLGLLLMIFLTVTKKPLEKRVQVEHKPLVQVRVFGSGDMQAIVEGQGAVSPLHQGTLSAEVAGTVLKISEDLVAGGTFKRGQELVRLDPAEYKLDVILRKADVQTAEKNLQLAQEESTVAQEEWKRLDLKNGGDTPPPLVAKKPHLEAASASLEAAKAALDKARLFLKRTSMTAPFDGRVVSTAIDQGQYLVKGQAVAKIYSTEVAEITVNLNDHDLAWIDVPGLTIKSGQGSEARVLANFGGRQMEWKGRVVRSAGELDPRTRLVPVVVQVKRPYDTVPPLAAGMYVRVNILGHDMKGVSELPRWAIHDGDTVWLVDSQGRVKFQKVNIVRYFADNALINPGLSDGSKVIITNLKLVTNGMAVRIAKPQGQQQAAESTPSATTAKAAGE